MTDVAEIARIRARLVEIERQFASDEIISSHREYWDSLEAEHARLRRLIQEQPR